MEDNVLFEAVNDMNKQADFVIPDQFFQTVSLLLMVSPLLIAAVDAIRRKIYPDEKVAKKLWEKLDHADDVRSMRELLEMFVKGMRVPNNPKDIKVIKKLLSKRIIKEEGNHLVLDSVGSLLYKMLQDEQVGKLKRVLKAEVMPPGFEPKGPVKDVTPVNP